MRVIFNVAKRWDYLDANYFPMIKRAKEEERRLFLRDDELRKIFAAIDKDIRTALKKR
jgi:hypothetical protein